VVSALPRGNGVVMLGFDLAGFDEIVDQLVNGLPTVCCLQVSDDLLFGQNVA